MTIDSFLIDGIFNISDFRLNVVNINALIAPNGYGKSNVLRAIEFATMFLSSSEQERRRMMRSGFLPMNSSMYGKDFTFEICGTVSIDNVDLQFQYGYSFRWATEGDDGKIVSEWMKVKRNDDQRYRQMIKRTSPEDCRITSSPAARCVKVFEVSSAQLALSLIAMRSDIYLSDIATQLYAISLPNLETLDNPESYFSKDEDKGIPILDGATVSAYLYKLMVSDADSYAILKDGLLQLLPDIEEFSPQVITLVDGKSKIYDIRVKQTHNVRPMSISQLSSGSKRIIFLFTLCLAAQKKNVPLIMLEEPENSVHPRLMENLLLAMQHYASDTKILITSHSPYLMRYLQPHQMYFGVSKQDGLTHFAQVNSSQLKYLYRYAGDMQLTFGEFMFDFMLDIENEPDKIATFFKTL